MNSHMVFVGLQILSELLESSDGTLRINVELEERVDLGIPFMVIP